MPNVWEKVYTTIIYFLNHHKKLLKAVINIFFFFEPRERFDKKNSSLIELTCEMNILYTKINSPVKTFFKTK